MKNYLIKHLGLGYPVGSIVPANVFPGPIDGHIALGAIAETALAVNVEVPGFESPKDTGGDSAAVIVGLKAQLLEANGNSAAMSKRVDELEAEIEKLKTELETTAKDRDDWMKMAEEAQNKSTDQVLNTTKT